MRWALVSMKFTVPLTFDGVLCDGLPRMPPRSPSPLEPQAASRSSTARMESFRIQILLRQNEQGPRRLQRPRTTLFLGSIAAVLYFSEGLPYGIVRELVPAFLRFQHVGLPTIGVVTSVAALAWTLKFLWSPLVDTFGSYRRWIAGALIAMALSLAGIAATAGHIGIAFYVFLALLTFGSATQDIAVDAFTIRATPKTMLGPVNSIRVTAYRV